MHTALIKQALDALLGYKPQSLTHAKEQGMAIIALREALAQPVQEPAKSDLVPMVWRKGYPPHPWDKEWFIARTIHLERVVLTALPEEYSYDFKTADETYMKKENITYWMQFPDSKFIAAPVQPAPLTDEQASKIARTLADENADACSVDRDDNWKIYGQDFIQDVRFVEKEIAALRTEGAG